jgi:hypothetical protein
MKRTLRRITVGVVAVLLMSSAMVSADVVLDWNAIMLNTIVVPSQNPFAQARFAAITHTAVFEAVNSITGDYEPYLGTINAPPGASAKAAAVAAAHIVLKNYFPSSAVNLDLARATSLAAIPDGQAKDDGIAVGEAAAAAMIANRASDGSAVPEFYMPPSANPGEWQPTPPLCPPAGGIFLHWRNLTPFAIRKADQFRSSPPPPLTSNKYSKAYNEVKEVGELQQQRAAAGSDRCRAVFRRGRPGTFMESGHESGERCPGQVALRECAGLCAAHHGHQRRSDLVDGNQIPLCLLAAIHRDPRRRHRRQPKDRPGCGLDYLHRYALLPELSSAHASGSYAGRTIAEKIFGSKGHDITLSHPSIPEVILHYTKFWQITNDIDDARVYSGIHFRFDQEAGARQGRRVGSYVYKNNLRRCSNHDKDCGDDE